MLYQASRLFVVALLVVPSLSYAQEQAEGVQSEQAGEELTVSLETTLASLEAKARKAARSARLARSEAARHKRAERAAKRKARRADSSTQQNIAMMKARREARAARKAKREARRYERTARSVRLEVVRLRGEV